MTTWFRSDDHFQHLKIIPYCFRPFTSIDEMNSELITRHNQVVKKDDEVYYLGDFSLSEKVVPIILPALNGRIHLILGNHDKAHPLNFKAGSREVKAAEAKKRYLDYGFVSVDLEMKLDPFILCHFPYLSEEVENKYEAKYPQWRPKNNGEWLLCGHVHQAWKTKNKMINVGCDVWDYAPVQLETLIAIKENSK